ncbi:MAG: TIGR02678 family protein [Bacilli bacterium]
MNNYVLGIDLLLNNFWILKSTNRVEYQMIKSNIDAISEFFINKLGSKIIVNQTLIKLEKIPAYPRVYMGLPDFTEVSDYVLLLIVLCFLENKGDKEQFILSSLTTYVENHLSTLKLDIVIDWNLYKSRKSLVTVLRFLTKIGVLKVTDGNDIKFSTDATGEVLYEVSFSSHYVVRNFSHDILHDFTIEDFLKDEDNEETDEVSHKRFQVYRELIYSAATFYDDTMLSDMDYLKNYRYRISKDIKENLEATVIINKSSSLISYEVDKIEHDSFPNTKAISDIVLLVNKEIQKKKFMKTTNDLIILKYYEFAHIIESIKKLYEKRMSKEYREMSSDKLTYSVIKYMQSFDMLSFIEDEVIIYPVVGLISGFFPLEEDQVVNNNEQLSIELEA